MKNKGLTYALLIVVAFIWYKVFFRVKDNLFADNMPIPESQEQRLVFSAISRDTFKLKADYRDPFGYVAPSNSTEIPALQIENRIPVVHAPKQQLLWPKIKYYGLVKKTESEKALALLNIDGMNFSLRKGESIFDGITIKTIGRDSVQVVYKMDKRVFWRE